MKKGDSMKKMVSVLCMFLMLLFIVGCQSKIVSNDVTGGVVNGVIYGPPVYGTEKQERQGADMVTVKEFHIVADNEFRPNYLEVNKGDYVRLIIYASVHNYGFVLSEYGINEYLEEDDYKTIEFVADTPGTFSFWSNVYSGPQTPYINGRLVVKDTE